MLYQLQKKGKYNRQWTYGHSVSYLTMLNICNIFFDHYNLMQVEERLG